MRRTSRFLALGLLLSAGAALGAEPVPAVGPEQLQSAAWWRGQAVEHAQKIADADARGRTHYNLVYCLARAGDFKTARSATGPINDPQLRIYALDFLANELRKNGDKKAGQAELRQAAEVALGWDSNFGYSHVIRTYLDWGQPDEAIALAERLPKVFYRNNAFQDIAAALAGQGKLDRAHDVVKNRLPPQWEETSWLMMAEACTDKLRIDDASALASRLTKKEYQDRVYNRLVQALVKDGKAAEAGAFADRISDPVLRATAKGIIATKLAEKLDVKTLRARLDQAATREKKLALYEMLFKKLIETGKVEDAEAAIESMIKTIQDTPREAQSSKFGLFDDAGAIAAMRSKYLSTAAVLAKQGDQEGSRRRIDQVRDVALHLPDSAGLAKIMLVQNLVIAELQIGDIHGARITLDQLETNFPKSSLEGRIAAGLIKSGDVKSGLEVAQRITPSVGAGMALGAVASALLEAGELKAAKTLLQKVGDGRDDVEAFEAAGQTLAELGKTAELHQWIGELKSETARACMCIGAAETLQSEPERR
ncbi:MAG: hypothetical protein JW818_13750 [Pirellulales bacterium]|nr:hypothetical protein [Pirellulales bacterium]